MLAWLPSIPEKEKQEQDSSEPGEWQETASRSLLPSNPDPLSGIQGPLAFVWPLNQTRDTRLLIKPDSISSILTPPQICNPENPFTFPDLIVVVCSAVANFDARTAIRNSWAQDQNTLKGVRVIFLLGQEENSTHDELVREEADFHGDILQESFIDTYANLTVKSVMLLKWFTNTCDISSKMRTNYVLKTDDDMYVNLPKLVQLVRENRKPNLLMGCLICNAVPIKDPHNKWFNPRYMFNEKKYPNYLSGTGYLMHRDTAVQLYSVALSTPLFHLEDIYMTGILARKARIRPIDNIGFSYVRRTLNSCLIKQSITTHQIKHKEMLDIYKKLKKSIGAKCPKLKTKQLRNYGPGRCTWPVHPPKKTKKN